MSDQTDLNAFSRTEERKQRHRVEMELGELVDTVGGGTPKTDNDEYWGGEHLWLTPSEVSSEESIHVSDTERKLTDEGLSNTSAKLLPPGSVLLTSRATVGIPVINEKPMATNQGFIGIDIKSKNRLDNYYLLYWLKDNKQLIMNHASGSTYPEISQTSFNNLNIELPSIEVQKKVGSTLRQIDTKREVNTRINELLEEVAQTLYKSWFIDFDPYDEFRSSKLGKVPIDFEIVDFSDICNTSGGGTPSTDVEEYWGGRNRWLTPKEVTALNSSVAYDTERKLTEKGLDNTSAKLMPVNSILLTSRATVGDVVINKKPMATNQGFICINPDDHIQPHYMLQLVKSKRKTIESLASGSTYPEISQTDFNSIEVFLPPEEDRQRYEDKAKKIYRKIHLNQKENDNLAQLRDTLLPKLMSGEINLNPESDSNPMTSD